VLSGDKRNGKADLSWGWCWGRRLDHRRGSGGVDGRDRGSNRGKEIGEVGEGLVLGGVEGVKRRRRRRIPKGMDQITGGGQGAVGGRGSRHGDPVREPREGVGNTFSTCFGDPDTMVAIMM